MNPSHTTRASSDVEGPADVGSLATRRMAESPRPRAGENDHELELSVVMPCLNEADTLATCIRKAQRALEMGGITGEIVVADNGSTDGSREIALALGARLVDVAERGYGSALTHGIRAARGRYVLMGDADDSYDFLELPRFVAKLREGHDLVQGCRLPAGGGTILPGAMPTSHRWIGNPMLSALARLWFQAPIRDVYCGMRAFRRDFHAELEQSCTGMEFATEMIILASRSGANIAEVPITLHPDGRIAHPPHLRTIRDGWRTLRLFLVYSPRWLYGHPARALAAIGALGYTAIAMGWIGDDRWAAFLLVLASLAGLGGFQAAMFAQLAEAWHAPASTKSSPTKSGQALGVLEKDLLIGGVLILLGLFLALRPLVVPYSAPIGMTLRWIVPGMTLVALGFQLASFGFFVHLLGQRRR
jgi:glycosyltransferase involved in cell wall biosynthesis